MSACTHGLRIENLAILTEKAPEVKAKLTEYVDYYKPTSPGERELCETAAVASVQKRRVLAAQKAKINKRVRRARRRYDERQEKRLERAQSLLATQVGAGLQELKRFALGLRWLLSRLERLAALLERDGTLYGSDRDELIRLMGSEPDLDRLYLSEGAYLIWLYCAVTKPEPVQEEIQALGAEEILPVSLRDRPTYTWLPPASLCRSLLKEQIDDEIEVLRRREQTLRENYEEPEREDCEEDASLLTGPDSVLVARYYKMHELEWHRAYTALVKGRELTAKTGRIPGAPTEEACEATEAVGAPTETDGAPNEASEASPRDASSSDKAVSMPVEEAVLTLDFAAEAAARGRRQAAHELAAGEADGIGAPIARGDRFLTVILNSRWWEQVPVGVPTGLKRGEKVNGKPPEPKRRE
jgi:hypothetical protein